MSILGKRIKKLRKEKDITQEDFGNYLNLRKSTISQYESGTSNPDYATLLKIADFFGVSVDYLLGRTDSIQFDLVDALQDNNININATGQPLTPEQRLAIARALDNPSAFKKKTVPILGKVPAGIPVLADGCWDGELEIPSDIEADFALEVKGDSMIGAGIHEGDYAICRDAHGANSGDIVVALKDIGPEYSEGTLKYYFNENGGVLRAANPEYEDIPLGGSHRITGIMIGLIRKGHTPFGYYRDYISIRDYRLQDWNDVIEVAVAGGIKPEFVKQFVENQIEMAKNLAKIK